MISLLTLLGIAAFSIVFIVVFKVIEKRLGRHTFLPEFVCVKDEQIERHTHFVLKKVVWWCRFRTATLMHFVYEKVRRTIAGVFDKTQIPQILHRGATASVFLKEVVAHKNQLRQDPQDSLS